MEELKKDIVMKNLILKSFIKLSSGEREIVRTLRNDILVRKSCYSDHFISAKEHINFIKKLKVDNQNFYWLVKKGSNYIGVISLNKVDFENRNAYLGIYSNPELKGMGCLLINCLKEITFNMLHLHTLKLEVIKDNKKAISLYRKSGFQKKGELKDFILKNGKYKNVILMEMINKDENRN